MNESRLIHAVGFIDDELISQAADHRPSERKSNVRIAGFAASSCAAAVVAAVFALFAGNIFPRDKGFVPSGDISNSADIGTVTRTFEDWLNDPAVVWGEAPSKDSPGAGMENSDASGERVPLGNTMISGKWQSEIPYETVFAVMVDFSPCIDKAEMENWEFDGDTISALKSEHDGYFFDTGETCEVTYFKDGVLHTEYEPVISSNPEDSDRIFELEQRIEELTSAYYNMKITGFRESFAENGLEVYVSSGIDSTLVNSRFYTFATREQLENFRCKENEAFLFLPASRLK